MAPSKSSGDWATRVRERIRFALVEHEISAAEVARRLGWTQSYMAHRLTGRRPFALPEVEAIATELGVSPNEFVADREVAA